MDQLTAPANHVVNAGFIAAGFSTLLGWLPPIAAFTLTLMGICWYGVQFYDRFFGRGRSPKRDE